MVKRTTPQTEIDRINERIFREHRPKTQEEYDQAFNRVIERRDDEMSTGQKRLRRRGQDSFTGRLDKKRKVIREEPEVIERKIKKRPVFKGKKTKFRHRTTFKRRGKTVKAFRDSKGRFA